MPDDKPAKAREHREGPIFYPVTGEAYAREIAEKWNLKESSSGYVTRFRIGAEFIESQWLWVEQ